MLTVVSLWESLSLIFGPQFSHSERQSCVVPKVLSFFQSVRTSTSLGVLPSQASHCVPSWHPTALGNGLWLPIPHHPLGRGAHLQPVPVVDVAPDVGCIGANGQLECGPQREPAPLHSKGHEAGAQHGRPQVEVQVGHWDVGLPVSRRGIEVRGTG